MFHVIPNNFILYLYSFFYTSDLYSRDGEWGAKVLNPSKVSGVFGALSLGLLLTPLDTLVSCLDILGHYQVSRHD